MQRFLTPAGEASLMQAIKAIEECSSAEIVVVIRPQSASYLHIDMAVGMVAAIATLTVLLFAPWPVAWIYLLLDPILFGVGIGFVGSRLGVVRRLLSRRITLARSVDRAAKTMFLERGVHNTRNRTGVLVYVSMLERSCAVIADSGIELAVPSDDWRLIGASLSKAVRSDGQATALAKAMHGMSDLLERYLPRHDDDLNELEDGVSS